MALEQSSKNMETNGSNRNVGGRRSVRWDNLTLESPGIGSSLEYQLSGLTCSA